MKALFLGSDPTLFVPQNATKARMRSYADCIGELHILSRAAKNSEEHDGPLHLYGVRTPKLLAPLVLAKRANKLVREKGIEIVSAQDPFEHGWAAVRAVRGTGAKLHIQIHTDFLSPWFVKTNSLHTKHRRAPVLNMIRRRIADKVLPHADGIRAVSKRVKDSVIKEYGARVPEPSVIPIAVSQTLPPRMELPPHAFAFSLIAASRLEPEKRIEDILDAIARIVLRYPSVGLFVVGDGRDRKCIQQRIDRLGLATHVTLLGEKSLEETLGLLQGAQAFIQASAYEGYGRTLIEAALARIPIITTDVGVVGEVFAGYDEVLAAPPGDPAALANHIAGLVEDQTARRSLVIAAENAARKHLAAFPDIPALIAQDLAGALFRRQ